MCKAKSSNDFAKNGNSQNYGLGEKTKETAQTTTAPDRNGQTEKPSSAVKW